MRIPIVTAHHQVAHHRPLPHTLHNVSDIGGRFLHFLAVHGYGLITLGIISATLYFTVKDWHKQSRPAILRMIFLQKVEAKGHSDICIDHAFLTNQGSETLVMTGVKGEGFHYDLRDGINSNYRIPMVLLPGESRLIKVLRPDPTKSERIEVIYCHAGKNKVKVGQEVKTVSAIPAIPAGVDLSNAYAAHLRSGEWIKPIGQLEA